MGCFGPKKRTTETVGEPEAPATRILDTTTSRKSLEKKQVEAEERNRVHVAPGEEGKLLEQVDPCLVMKQITLRGPLPGP